jgi:1-acyl-sn-glycerol-3-phosphate acyltransferase
VGDGAEARLMIPALRDLLVTAELDAQLARIERVTGSYAYDPWGYNLEAAKPVIGVLKRAYDHYFRVQAHGVEHIPPRGRLLIIGNHSGQLPIDGLLIGVALLTNPHAPRAPRAMIERFFPKLPFIGDLLNRMGAAIGDPLNCARMLENEEAVIVFPEGVRGSGKLYRDRYQLQRFGTGFMHLAMTHHTPILPVGVVGCEETMPSLANIAPLARLLGLPYVPVTTPIPLPARVTLHFGEPMRFDGATDDEDEVIARVERVRESIGALVERGLAARTSVF